MGVDGGAGEATRDRIALHQPARQVGGDFYDVIELAGGRFGIVVADVSDKGMPAAFYMALTRSLLLAEDPFGGLELDDSCIWQLTSKPGLGVFRKPAD